LSNTDPLKNTIKEFSKMPGIGYKTAQRLAFYLLSLGDSEIGAFINSIKDLQDNVRFCTNCFHITYKEDLCSICSSEKRDKTTICIVCDSKDVLAMEKMGKFKGTYHVLGGVISPLDGIGPEQLRIKELLGRLKNDTIKEIIFALNPSIEGETTTMYMTKLLSPLGMHLSQIAYGIPVGSDLEWADEMTLSHAYEGRNNLKGKNSNE